MPPKRRKFESTFPAARIKKIMQLDDDVGRVASSVPVLISRAVEIFLQALLTRTADHASSRNAKTLSVNHLKYCIEHEKQWDFLKDLTANIADVGVEEEGEEGGAPKKSRKRRQSPKAAPASKRRQAAATAAAAEAVEDTYESILKPSLQSAITTTHTLQAAAVPLLKPSPLAQLALSTAHTADVSPLAALSTSLKQQANHTDEEDYDV
ncbi:hypothetical protein EMCRGX_G032732 [Ephydatia muelleri]